MSISIISTSAGNGHNVVMNTLKEGFKHKGYDVKGYPTFYEDLMPSNRVLHDFYNSLLETSFPLAIKYNELSVLQGERWQNELYRHSYNAIDQFIQKDKHMAIISTTPLLNKLILLYFKDNKLIGKIPFYIVVTDPYDPIYPGFEVKGANGYFCPNDTVGSILLNAGVEADKIKVFGYPVSCKFCCIPSDDEEVKIYNKYGLDPTKPVLLINSSTHGSLHYFNILKSILSQHICDMQIVMVCGKNRSLYNAAKFCYPKDRNKDIVILPYVNNIEELLYIADACLTKAGANTVYECLFTCTPLMIDAINGLLYQEKGIVKFLEQNKVGYVCKDDQDICQALDIMYNTSWKSDVKARISAMNIVNGTERIVANILNDIGL
ncbi:MAG: hypothetical protein MJB12_20075 [Firmicutes bacterium]|nr:hypothetical protein [Bacillota bacterium]